MRKNFFVSLILIVLLISVSCSKDASEYSSSSVVDADKKVPLWAQEEQITGELFQQLNLDGIGGMDDEVYISTYQFGDFNDSIITMYIHLGTGETMAKIFPVCGYYKILTGKIFSEQKDAIVLEVEYPYSNFGAASIFVLDIYPVGLDPVPTIAVRMDTFKDSTIWEKDDILTEIYEVTAGTEIVDIEGLSLQGIKIYAAGEQGRYQEMHRTFYWYNNRWAIFEE